MRTLEVQRSAQLASRYAAPTQRASGRAGRERPAPPCDVALPAQLRPAPASPGCGLARPARARPHHLFVPVGSRRLDERGPVCGRNRAAPVRRRRRSDRAAVQGRLQLDGEPLPRPLRSGAPPERELESAPGGDPETVRAPGEPLSSQAAPLRRERELSARLQRRLRGRHRPAGRRVHAGDRRRRRIGSRDPSRRPCRQLRRQSRRTRHACDFGVGAHPAAHGPGSRRLCDRRPHTGDGHRAARTRDA